MGVLKADGASMSRVRVKRQSRQTDLSKGREDEPIAMDTTWERTLRTAKKLEWIVQARLKEPALTPKEARMLREILGDARTIQSLGPGEKR